MMENFMLACLLCAMYNFLAKSFLALLLVALSLLETLYVLSTSSSTLY